MNCSSIPDYTHTLDLVVALGGIPSAFFFLFPTDYPVNYQSAKSKVMNNKKKNEGQTDFSYYGLYLLDYLRTNKFEQADDTAFIRERADRAAETYERARLEGYPADGAQELAMDTLLRGLHYSRYAILREVVENEFADEVPEEKREAFVLKLLPLVGNVFSVYDLSDDNFALSSDYDLLYTELTGATVITLPLGSSTARGTAAAGAGASSARKTGARCDPVTTPAITESLGRMAVCAMPLSSGPGATGAAGANSMAVVTGVSDRVAAEIAAARSSSGFAAAAFTGSPGRTRAVTPLNVPATSAV